MLITIGLSTRNTTKILLFMIRRLYLTDIIYKYLIFFFFISMLIQRKYIESLFYLDCLTDKESMEKKNEHSKVCETSSESISWHPPLNPPINFNVQNYSPSPSAPSLCQARQLITIV